MKNLLPTIVFLILGVSTTFAQSIWDDPNPTLLGVLQKSLSYIELGAENNLDQAGVQTYFKEIFDKPAFDQLYIETAEYGWDTITYHYLSALYYLNIPNLKAAQASCYQAGQVYLTTAGPNRNVLSRFGLTFGHINHLREYIDLGEHDNERFLGYDGTKEVTGYSGFTDVQLEIPAFPWPPPQASSNIVLPSRLLGDIENMQAIDDKILAALDSCSYDSRSYFTVPGGFALVTQMEQFNEDGTSETGKNRWNISLKPASFKLSDYFKALFWGREGKYRILVFIITDQPFYEKNDKIEEENAREWLKTGAKWLPSGIASTPFTKDHHCTALIYEFELKESLTQARFLPSGTHTGMQHLQQSRIWENLK